MRPEAAELRRQLRELVNSHVPDDFLGAFTDNPADLETTQQFCRTLAEHNLLCLSWPEEFGGGGASVWEQTVVREEMWAHHEPRGASTWVSTGPVRSSCDTRSASTSTRSPNRRRSQACTGARTCASTRWGFGCHGEYVEKEDEMGPAIERAFASGKTAVVNVCIDPKANAEEMPKYDEFRTWYAEGTQ